MNSPTLTVRDDAPALQKLIDSGGAVDLKAGRLYTLSRALNVGGSTRITGNGATLRMTDNAPVNTPVGETLSVTGPGVQIRGVRFDGNTAKRGHGTDSGSFAAGTIVARGATDMLIADCEFAGSVMDDICLLSSTEAAGATPATACRWVTIQNCSFALSQRNNISAVSVNHLTITGNTFRDQRGGLYGGQCIDCEANPQDAPGCLSDIDITANAFDNCRLGIIVNSQHNPFGVRITGNRFTGGDIGVSNWADGTVIEGNYARDMGNIGLASGVVLPTGSVGAGVLRNNTACRCAAAGIFLDGVAGHVVGGNTAVIVATPAAKGWRDAGGNTPGN